MPDTTDVYRVSDLLQQRGVGLPWLAQSTNLEERIVKAIYYQRYTPSREQRTRVARVLQVSRDQILWGHANHVESMKEPI